MRSPILAACPTHGRVHHFYNPYMNAWMCRLIDLGCRHAIADEEVEA